MVKDNQIMLLLKMVLVSLIAFITPIQCLIVGIGALIAFDTVTGVYKAYKTGVKITSVRFGHIISKLLLYNIAVISGYILQLMIGLDIVPLAKIISVAISLTELKSIAENVNAVTGIDIWIVVKDYLKRNGDDVTKDIMNQPSPSGNTK